MCVLAAYVCDLLVFVHEFVHVFLWTSASECVCTLLVFIYIFDVYLCRFVFVFVRVSK